MVSLAQLWMHHGVSPAAVVGHSQGEIAAAYIAGALSLEEAAKISALRSQALRQLAGTGTMASLGTTQEQTREWLAELAPDVSIAAINGPASIVVSGPPDQITALVAHAEANNARARTIDVDYASHHPDIDRITDDLTDALMGIMPTTSDIAFYSTVTGGPVDTLTLDTSYWITNLRQPVRFADTITALLGDGHRVFIETSPHPVLTFGIQQTIDAEGVDAVTVPTLRRDHGGEHQFTHAAATAHAHGTTIDWTGWYPGPQPTIPLPTYAFQRRRYWLEPSAEPMRTATSGTGDGAEAALWEAIEQDDLDAVTATVHAELNGDTDGSAREKLADALPILSAWRRRNRERSRIEANRYRVTWTPLTQSGTPALSGTYLLLTPDGDHPAVRATQQALTAHGATVHTDTVSPAADRAVLTERLTELTIAHDPVAIISLLALDTTPHAGHPAVPVGLAATITLVQAHVDATPDAPAPLWCVTQGAVATGDTDALPNPHQATVWGAGRTAALEHPHHWGGLIDLPAELASPYIATALAVALTPGQPEDQVAIRATTTYTRRLTHAPVPATPAVPWTPTGTTLITGGTGGIGAAVARWLAGNGAGHLLLLSRRGPDHPDAQELTEEITRTGAKVTITACDVSDRAQLENAIAAIPPEHPLTGVIHAAGLPENAPLPGIDVPHIEQIIGPKAYGATLLHELTRDLKLTAFVLFSSGAAVWGSGSQACYSAANSYLDALAEHRRANGLPATSIQWGPWSDVGMAANEPMMEFYGRRGFTYFTPEQGIAAMRTALTHGETTLCFADADWRKFVATFTARRPSLLLSGLVPATEAAPTVADPEADSEFRRQLAAATPDQRLHLLLIHVQTHSASILGHTDPGAVNPKQPFHQQGFDSLTAVELRNRLTATTGLVLPPTLIFDHPSPTDLADFLSRQLAGTDVADEGRILSDLDKWDLLCEPAAIDEAARQRVSRRLALLLQKWSATGDQNGDSTTAHQDLEDASAEDIFDLIAEEFGKS
jgi:acyl transferase domain-containing protein